MKKVRGILKGWKVVEKLLRVGEKEMKGKMEGGKEDWERGKGEGEMKYEKYWKEVGEKDVE